jgi:hypothetical protein
MDYSACTYEKSYAAALKRKEMHKSFLLKRKNIILIAVKAK